VLTAAATSSPIVQYHLISGTKFCKTPSVVRIVTSPYTNTLARNLGALNVGLDFGVAVQNMDDSFELKNYTTNPSLEYYLDRHISKWSYADFEAEDAK